MCSNVMIDLGNSSHNFKSSLDPFSRHNGNKGSYRQLILLRFCVGLYFHDVHLAHLCQLCSVRSFYSESRSAQPWLTRLALITFLNFDNSAHSAVPSVLHFAWWSKESSRLVITVRGFAWLLNYTLYGSNHDIHNNRIWQTPCCIKINYVSLYLVETIFSFCCIFSQLPRQSSFHHR